MNRIKSVVTQVAWPNVVTGSYDRSIKFSDVCGQRVKIAQIDDRDLLIPLTAHIIEINTKVIIQLKQTIDLHPGQVLTLTNPHGNGIEINQSNDKLAFVLIGESSFLTNVLKFRADLLNYSVSVYSQERITNLPSSFEVSSNKDLSNVFDWADQIFFETDQRSIPVFIEQNFSGKTKSVRQKSSVFVNGDYGCMGVGECCLCEFQSGSRRIRLCDDGPVLRMSDLLS